MAHSMEKWKGKVAVVTGASSGIGAAISRKLVEEGLQVVGLARRKEKLEELSNQLKTQPGHFHPIQCDVTIEAEIVEAFKWATTNLGPISILVNSAGVFEAVELTKDESQKIRSLFDVNVISLSVATREATKSMLTNAIDGHVIHISSMAAHEVYLGISGAYCASKFAVRALTEALRKEFNQIGSKTRITSITPGAVDTEMSSGLQGIPKLRASDVAEAVIYVLSTPDHVNVQEIVIRPVGEHLG